MSKLIVKVNVFLFLFCFLVSATSLAQESKVKSVNRATVIGVGKSSLTDTYLSPLKYTGTNVSILTERIAQAGFISDDLLLRQQFSINTAFTKNPSSSSSEYYGNLSYNIGGLYPLLKYSNFRLFAGAGLDASLGGIYNMRNSNNPGSLKTSINIDLSAMAIYNWSIFTFRWQLSTPFAGVFFSPGYGQSYYEIFSLGNGAGTIMFASFNNYIAVQNYFTVDIPINNFTIRTGYIGNYYKTDVNSLQTNITSHQFVLGFAVESLDFGGKKYRNTKFIESVYY